MPPQETFENQASKIESEPYFEQLCKQNHYKFHLEFSPQCARTLGGKINGKQSLTSFQKPQKPPRSRH